MGRAGMARRPARPRSLPCTPQPGDQPSTRLLPRRGPRPRSEAAGLASVTPQAAQRTEKASPSTRDPHRVSPRAGRPEQARTRRPSFPHLRPFKAAAWGPGPQNKPASGGWRGRSPETPGPRVPPAAGQSSASSWEGLVLSAPQLRWLPLARRREQTPQGIADMSKCFQGAKSKSVVGRGCRGW